ncbi:hAT dimerization domain-containing protein/transposase-like protein [Gossypium australe]|uniref:HAT dimerization domain-containing protein/transposase-like protein n=1 Tax=Gossypium australe TaxID=47621 RepID=A0A5B6X3Y6_9ROSI|nr:hAT dimerization domain-containing protein/transposase-like protein [Gossypium australe]
MVTSSEWRRSTYARKTAGLDIMDVINSSRFWKKAVDVLKIQEPLVKVLRMCDGDEKPTMGFIYEAMDKAKLTIQRDCLYYKKYSKIIDRRWSNQLHGDLHSTIEWWINYGSCAPQLQCIAIKVLSQTTLSSNCERN